MGNASQYIAMVVLVLVRVHALGALNVRAVLAPGTQNDPHVGNCKLCHMFPSPHGCVAWPRPWPCMAFYMS